MNLRNKIIGTATRTIRYIILQEGKDYTVSRQPENRKGDDHSSWKRLGILLCIAALCSVLLLSTSCGAKYANSEYVGKWKATSASMSGISVNVEKVIGDFVLELKDDGSAKVTIGKDSAKGDWEETDKGIKLKDSKDELEFKKESKGKMSMNYSGMKLVFEKQ